MRSAGPLRPGVAGCGRAWERVDEYGVGFSRAVPRHIPFWAAYPLPYSYDLAQYSVTAPVTLDVLVTVLDPDKTPAAGLSLRVVLGASLTWQAAEEGERVLTEADGTAHVRTVVALDDRRHKMPTNFFSSLVTSRERTQHVQVAVEMEYAGRGWLTAIDLDYFENGSSTQLDPMRVFGRAANGRFTDDIPLRDGTRTARLPKGVVLPVPGFDLTSATLEPESAGSRKTHWTLRLTLTRWPAPVVKHVGV